MVKFVKQLFKHLLAIIPLVLVATTFYIVTLTLEYCGLMQLGTMKQGKFANWNFPSCSISVIVVKSMVHTI